MEMTEDDDNAMFRTELHDRLLNALILLRFGNMLFRVMIAGNEVLIKALNTFAGLEVVDSFIGCDSVNPAEELAFPVEGVEVFKGLDECRLGDFACIVIVIDDPQGDVENLFPVSLDEDLERLLIPGNAVFDEVGIDFNIHKYNPEAEKLIPSLVIFV